MRNIIASAAFDAAVQLLGGYRAIDEAMETLIDGLMRNPYGFERFESDFISFRYARIRRTDWVDPLFVVFRIDDDRNVILEHIEKDIDAD